MLLVKIGAHLFIIIFLYLNIIYFWDAVFSEIQIWWYFRAAHGYNSKQPWKNAGYSGDYQEEKNQTCTVVYICHQQKSGNKPPAIPSLIKTIPWQSFFIGNQTCTNPLPINHCFVRVFILVGNRHASIDTHHRFATKIWQPSLHMCDSLPGVKSQDNQLNENWKLETQFSPLNIFKHLGFITCPLFSTLPKALKFVKVPCRHVYSVPLILDAARVFLEDHCIFLLLTQQLRWISPQIGPTWINVGKTIVNRSPNHYK